MSNQKAPQSTSFTVLALAAVVAAVGSTLAATSSPAASQVLAQANDRAGRASRTPATAASQSYDRPRLTMQTGHPGGVIGVDVSADGKYVLTAGRGGIVQVWDAASGRQIRRLGVAGRRGQTASAVFSPDGLSVVTGSFGSTPLLWDLSSGREIRRFEGDRGRVTEVAFSPDGKLILTGGSDQIARLWRAADGTEVCRLAGHTGGITAVSFAGDGKSVATASNKDAAARVWDVAGCREIRQLPGDQDGVSAVAFSPDGRLLVTGEGRNRTVRLWDAATGRELRQFDQGRPLDFSPDGGLLAIAVDDAIELRDVSTGESIGRLRPQFKLRGSVVATFTPDGRHLLIGGSGDPAPRLWDVRLREEMRRFGGQADEINAVAISPDGRNLVTANGGGAARLWDTHSGSVVRVFSGHAAPVYDVAISRDGRVLATGGGDNTARIWDLSDGSELGRFEGHSDRVRAVALSPDARLLLTGSGDATARLWDVRTGNEKQRFEGHRFGVASVAFSPDGRFVVTASADDTARIWDIDTGRQVKRFVAQGDISAVAYSADGRFVVTAGGDGGDPIARVWDASSGELLLQLPGHEGPLTTAVFSPDDRHVLTGGWDGTARMWEVASGREVLRLEGHSSYVRSAVFSPDGRFVLTGSSDQTARLWDAETGKQLCQIVGFRDGTWAVVDSQGRFDAANGGDIDGLHWVVGLEPIALSQLKERYYDPQLLSKTLGLSDQPLRDVAAFDTPELYPNVVTEILDRQNAILRIGLENRGGGIGRVVVLINGKEIAADARGTEANPDAESLQLDVNLANHPYLVPGEENTIEVRAFNAEGYLSSRGVSQLFTPAGQTTAAPTLWGIFAGVSDYDGDALDLRYAAKDARDMAGAVRLGAQRLFGAQQVRLEVLSTGSASAAQPTKANFRRAFAAAEAAEPTDILMIYLAGHGIALGDEYYFLTAQARSAELADPAVREQVAISSAELVEWLKQSPALKQVMVLDTCAAGQAAGKLVEKRDIASDQIRAIERLKDRTGFHVLMGSAADAVSFEATQYEQGLLTYALLHGMRGAALRENEFIDVSTLFQHAADEVPKLASNIGGIQRPRIAAPRGTSFDVGQLTAEDREAIPLASAKPHIVQPFLLNPDKRRDDLKLSARLREYLREQSYASVHGGVQNLPAVFVDSEELPGAIQPSGVYAVEGSTVSVNLVLVRDDEELAELEVDGSVADIPGLTAKMAEAIWRGVSVVTPEQ